jgi:hypothetical protein
VQFAAIFPMNLGYFYRQIMGKIFACSLNNKSDILVAFFGLIEGLA